MRLILSLVLVGWLGTLSGCAMIAGTVAGPVGGAIDLPAETYRQNCPSFVKYPILYGVDAVVLGPVGFVLGPVFGMGKGLSLDIQWCLGQVDYSDVFGSYDSMSVLRPFTLRWPVKAGVRPCDKYCGDACDGRRCPEMKRAPATP